MLNSIWPESNGDNKPLPEPNVVVARSGTPPEHLSKETVKGILVNPIYTGVGPFPRLVEDVAWVRACAMPLAIQTIETYGRSNAFLHVHVLAQLAQTEATVEWAIKRHQGIASKSRQSPRPRQLLSRTVPHLHRLFPGSG